jgi:hypothetical protein
MTKKIMFLFVFSLFLLSPGTQVQAQTEEIIWTKRTLKDLGIKGDVMNAIFSPDDSRICVTTTKTFVELDPTNGEIIREIPEIRGAKCFSDDGNFFYTYDLKKVNYETMEVVGQFELPTERWTEPDFWTRSDFVVNEKQGLLIASVQHGLQYPTPFESIFVYDLNTYAQIKVTGIKNNYVRYLFMSPNGDYFITYSYYYPDQGEERSVKMLWSTVTLDTIKEISDLRANMKFSPDGNLLGSVSGNLVRVHDTKTWEMKYEFMQDPYNGLLTALDFTSDSKYFATGGKGSPVITNIHIWNLEKGELETKFNDLFNVLIPDKLYFNKNGSNILVSSAGRISLLNVPTTGVTEKGYDGESIIYPNPSSGKIEFDNNSFRIGELSIQLSDVNGKQIEILYDEIYNGEYLSFDISYLPKGIYFITVTQKDYVHTYKLIKE